MIKSWQKLGLLLVTTMAFTACHHVEPIYNVTGDPVPEVAQLKLSTDAIGKIITKTALEKGWTVDEVKPGVLRCAQRWQGHSATINIIYSKRDYSIALESSENLREADGRIHRKYNELVHELQAEIDKRLSLISLN